MLYLEVYYQLRYSDSFISVNNWTVSSNWFTNRPRAR